MINWLLVLTAITVFLILLARTNLYIALQICRHNNDDYLAITVSAFRQFLCYNIKVPVIMVIEHDHFPWISSELETSQETTKTKAGREQRFIRKTIKLLLLKPKRFWRLFRLTKHIYRNYMNYMDKLCQGLHCEKFELKTAYGFEDAAYTGIFMGVLGALIQLHLTALHNRISLDTKPSIYLQPHYSHSQFQLELSCIFRIRLGNVITATIAVLRKLFNREATHSA